MRALRSLLIWGIMNLVLFALLVVAVSMSEWNIMVNITNWNMVKVCVFRPDGNFYLIGYDNGWQWELVDVNLCMPAEE